MGWTITTSRAVVLVLVSALGRCCVWLDPLLGTASRSIFVRGQVSTTVTSRSNSHLVAGGFGFLMKSNNEGLIKIKHKIAVKIICRIHNCDKYSFFFNW